MTQKEKRIAIAEKCRIPKTEDGYCIAGPGAIPDYFYDLNACHEMENALFPKEVYELQHRDKWVSYRENLLALCVGNPGSIIRATAAQRCEAFGKTLGLW